MSPCCAKQPFLHARLGVPLRFARRLTMLVLLGVWSVAPPAVAEVDQASVTAPESSAAQTHPAPSAVEALCAAAANLDAATFTRLLDALPELPECTVDSPPLLALLLSPAGNLPRVSGQHPIGADFSPEQAAMIRAAHAASLPVRQRLLALALQHGANPNAVSERAPRPPLHLALVFGSPEMVRLLLQHGAQVDAVDVEQSQTAVEFALDEEAIIRLTRLPLLVDPVSRSRMLMAVLAAGAGRPLATPEADKPAMRSAAEVRLWSALATLTRGGEIMEAFAKTGTSPVFDADPRQLSPLAHAARSGNLGGVKWLKTHMPRLLGDGDSAASDERQFDSWLLAACWALYPMARHAAGDASVDAILGELIQPGMPWGQNNKLLDGGRALAQPSAGQTLLHHLVFAGNTDGVRRVLALGAPVDGVDPVGQTPLLQAVRDGNLGMVRLLLSFAANPLASAGDGRSPLLEAIAPEVLPAEVARGSSEKLRLKEARREALRAMLLALSPQQKASLVESGHSLLRAAFEQNEAVDGPMVAALLEVGVSLAGLDRCALNQAVYSAERDLVGLLLDHGWRLEESSPAADGRACRPVLVEALIGQRPDLLPRLLLAGANPNLPDAAGRTAVAWAVALGAGPALDVLLANGGSLELAVGAPEKRSLLELALSSPSEAMVLRLLDENGFDLATVCLEERASLRHVVLDSSDLVWASLLGLGLGRPSASGPCAGLAPMPERLLLALLTGPASPAVGWRATRLVERLRDMTALMPMSEAHAKALLAAARAGGREDVAEVLSELGVLPPSPVLPVGSRPKADDLVLQRKLAGRYATASQRGLGSQIVLRADGQFEYLPTVGADDEAARGQWRVRDGRVQFVTPLPAETPARPPYQRIAAVDGGAADENIESFEVAIRYQGRPLGEVAVTAIGCVPPAMASGQVGTAGWRGSVGPLCQLVLQHPEINAGRDFVYQVPASEQWRKGRRFVFEVESPQPGSQTFNVEMVIDQEALLWRRPAATWRYVRQ